MKQILYFIIVLITLSFTFKVNAQPSWFWQPSASGPYTENPNYNNWQKVVTENFSDLTNWDKWDECGIMPKGSWTQPISLPVGANASVDANGLTLEVKDCANSSWCYGATCTDYQNVGYSYTSGVIQSKPNTIYSYGYYEASIKLPGWPDPNSQQSQYCGDGFHPSFWLNSGVISGGCPNDQGRDNEIDVMEPGGGQYAYANFIEGGFHDVKPPCWTNCDDPCCGDQFCENFTPTNNNPCDINTNSPQAYKVARTQITSATALNLDYHNYAVECLPDRRIFYFDRQPYAWILATECAATSVDQITHAFDIHGNNFIVVFGNAVDGIPGNYPYNNPPPGVNYPPTLPAGQSSWNMNVDTFYYWQLKPEYCGTSFTVNDESDLTYLINNLGVRQNITFGGSSGTINYPPDPTRDDITFRATDEIDIEPGFDATEGSTLSLIITPCN